MKQDTQELITKFIKFHQTSANWCIAESEKSVGQIYSVIETLVAETERVSALSQDTLEAVSTLQKLVKKIENREDRSSINHLAFSLYKVAKEREGAREIIGPIIEALQFQDRVKQNIENVLKVCEAWYSLRKEMTPEDEMNEEKLVEFGDQIMGYMTSPDEKDIIRSMIPGVKDDAAIDESVLFF